MNSQPIKSDIKQDGIRGRPRKRIILDSSIIAAGIIFFAVTTPQGTPSLLLLAGFLVIAAILVALADLILRTSGIHSRIGPGRRRGIYIVMAVVPVVLLLLQSLGQLSARDTAVILLLTVIGLFYMNSFRRKR